MRAVRREARAVQHVAKLDVAARRPHDDRRNARHLAVMRERWAAMTPEQRRAKQPLGGGAQGTPHPCPSGADDGRVPNDGSNLASHRHEQAHRQRVDTRKTKPKQCNAGRSEPSPRRLGVTSQCDHG